MSKCHISDREVERFGHMPMYSRQTQYAQAVSRKNPTCDSKKLGKLLKWKFGVCILSIKDRKTICAFNKIIRGEPCG